MRAIKNKQQFKECIRKNGYTNPFSGRSTPETYHLYYGFDRPVNLGKTNQTDAWRAYSENHEYFDQFITKGGFLDKNL